MKRTILASLLVMATTPVWASADTIYFGGDILTMDDVQPTAEAVAVQDGIIVGVGTKQEIKSEHANKDTQLVDLKGKTMMPGFIDSHSHLSVVAMKSSTVSMDPAPAGDVTSIKDIQRLFGWELAKRPEGTQDWLVGMNYDHVMLDEGRHPTRHDLDEVSTEVPILLIHFSGHGGVANSKLLEMLGFDENTPDPDGGIIVRERGTTMPNGVLQEYAFLPAAFEYMSTFGLEPDESRPDDFIQQMFEGLIVDALHDYAKKGYTTVSDVGLTPDTFGLFSSLANKKELFIDVAGATYMKGPATVEDVIPHYSEEYVNHFRLMGGKATIDGGSPGRTALLREPYHVQLEGEEGYVGYASMPAPTFNQHAEAYYAADIPLFVHALGDGAVDIALEGLEAAAKKHPGEDRRNQLIHVQQIQEDQFERVKALGATISFQVTHAFYNADFHAAQIFGPERTKRLVPANSAINHGISTTIHHDAPIHPVGQFELIWTAVNRTSRSGKVWGEDERISVMEALKASTIYAAYQFREEDRKGTLEAGKLADLVIVDQNPLEVEKDLLKDIAILETIKEGKTVYSAQND